jgi:hypothetical protein
VKKLAKDSIYNRLGLKIIIAASKRNEIRKQLDSQFFLINAFFERSLEKNKKLGIPSRTEYLGITPFSQKLNVQWTRPK